MPLSLPASLALPPSSSLLPGTLITITIALAAFALFVVALIIRRMFLSFVVTHHCGLVVVNAILSATALI
jgi:hypothetical protein